MIEIKMPINQIALINKYLHFKSDNCSNFHPQVGRSQLTHAPRTNLCSIKINLIYLKDWSETGLCAFEFQEFAF